jgi:hypothetical protein
MKIRVTIKDPDGFCDAIEQAAKDQVDQMSGVDEDEKDDLIESRRTKVSEALSKWVEYGEYMTVIFDTDEGTATVVNRT